MNSFVMKLFFFAIFFLCSTFDSCASGLKGRVLTPEQFGCSGLGPAKPDTECFSKMLSSARDGDSIKLKKGSNYYNSLPFGEKSVWTISKAIAVNGNGAKISRRQVAISRVTDDNQVATIRVENTQDVKIDNLNVLGGEARGKIVDKDNRAISTREYGVSNKINYGILIRNSERVSIRNVHVQDALFGVWVKSSSEILFDGEIDYSGQLVPIKGNDLQLGAGIKLSDVSNFNLNIRGINNTNALVEVEPNDVNGSVVCVAKNSFSSGLTVNASRNIVLHATLLDGERAGAQLVEGVRNISGSISTSGNGGYGVLISNFSQRTGGTIDKINLDINSKNNGNFGLYIANRPGNKLYLFNIKYSGSGNNIVRRGVDVMLRGVGAGKIYGISSGSGGGVATNDSRGVDLSSLNLTGYSSRSRIKSN